MWPEMYPSWESVWRGQPMRAPSLCPPSVPLSQHYCYDLYLYSSILCPDESRWKMNVQTDPGLEWNCTRLDILINECGDICKVWRRKNPWSSEGSDVFTSEQTIKPPVHPASVFSSHPFIWRCMQTPRGTVTVWGHEELPVFISICS